jgi:SAM-dependent methyltransferase
MKPANAFRQPQFPSTWQALPNGEMIRKTIELVLAPWWQKFFGYQLVKLGALSCEINIVGSTIKHQINLSVNHPESDVIANVDDLPLQDQSVDVCLLSHALEFSVDPHHVVREANRVLIPNGYLVITGFNPISLAGLNRFIPYRRQNTPWNEHFFSPMRIKDWLHLMGFEVLADQRCLLSSLTGKLNEQSLKSPWHNFANRYLTTFGSVYIIIAKKRVLPLTPIKPMWQIQTGFEPAKAASLRSQQSKTKGSF